MKTLSKEIIEKYDIEIENDRVHIHNPDGKHGSCIAFYGGFKVEEEKNYVTIHCENGAITLQKNNHSFHVTIFQIN